MGKSKVARTLSSIQDSEFIQQLLNEGDAVLGSFAAESGPFDTRSDLNHAFCLSRFAIIQNPFSSDAAKAKATDEMVKVNARYVLHFMKRVSRPADLSGEEFFTELFWKVGRAIDKFDPARGYNFSTLLERILRNHYKRITAQRRSIKNGSREVIVSLYSPSSAHSTKRVLDDIANQFTVAEVKPHVSLPYLVAQADLTPLEREVLALRRNGYGLRTVQKRLMENPPPSLPNLKLSHEKVRATERSAFVKVAQLAGMER